MLLGRWRSFSIMLPKLGVRDFERKRSIFEPP
jgi:hypothetical protein